MMTIFPEYGISLADLDRLGLAFLTRTVREPLKTISIISRTARDIMLGQNKRLRVVKAGARAFEIYDVNSKREFACPYRILTEFCSLFESINIVSKRHVQVPAVDLIRLINQDDSIPIETCFDDGQVQADITLQVPKLCPCAC